MFVGADETGNRYYRALGQTNDPSFGYERRWVVYNGAVEATKVPPGWRGWLTHTHDVPPSQEAYIAYPWEQPNLPNMTGTPAAYRPQGSTASYGERPPATGDYEAWSPVWNPPDVPRPEAHPGTHGLGLEQKLAR